MDIYILRDGQEMGPFSEETTQTLLKQGSVLLHDLAWRPGMPGWIPLHSVLYPASTVATAVKPPPPPQMASAPLPVLAPEPVPVVPAAPVEPATARQKAFLTYMGISFAPEISKEQAALLVNDAMEHPKDPKRLAKWNDDRLRLHPDLFAAELQAKKDNRANHFFEVAQAEGAEIFEGLAKAHCQVLVGYLDVKFPNWDANDSEAAWNYFFPAVAERFPEVVKKSWRDKLKYPQGPKVASQLKSPARGNAKASTPSPVAGLFKGLAFGLVILAVVAGGIYLKSHPVKLPDLASLKSSQTGDAKTDTPAESKPAGTPETAPASSPAVAQTAPAAAPAPAGDPAMTAPAPAADAPAAPAAPAAPGSMSLFDPIPGEAPAANPNAGAPGAAFPAPAAPQKKTNVVLTKPVEVPLPFGKAKLPAGTQLKLVAQEGGVLKVNFQNTVISIPASSTDLGAEAPATVAPAP